MKCWGVVCFLLAALAAPLAQAARPVVGVYVLAERGLAPVEALRPGQVTHLLYAFALICGPGQRAADAQACAGRPDFSLAPDAEQPRFAAAFERLKARDPGLQVLVSMGGWGGSDPFFHLAATAEGRAAFVASALDLLRRHPAFDGLDIDWEHPGSNGSANGVALGSPADGEHYVLLLQALRAGLDGLGRETGRHYLLTAAINTTREQMARMPMGRAAEALDLVFLMSYDFAGPWTPRAGHHTPLRSAMAGSDLSLTGAVANLRAAGVPAAKLVAGIAMYGRGFDGVRRDRHFAAPYPNADGSVAYKDLATLPGLSPVFDAKAQAWALVGPGLHGGQRYVGYDDPRAVRAKVAFAQAQGLAGVFAWELSQDNGELLQAMQPAPAGR